MKTEDQRDWRTSTFSANGADCVEVRNTGDGIEVRDTKDRSGPTLRFNPSEIRAFILGVKAGEFDDLT